MLAAHTARDASASRTSGTHSVCSHVQRVPQSANGC